MPGTTSTDFVPAHSDAQRRHVLDGTEAVARYLNG
jgi:hypothetical protein